MTQATMEQKRLDQQQALSQQQMLQANGYQVMAEGRQQSQQQMQMMADMMKAAVAAIATCAMGGN